MSLSRAFNRLPSTKILPEETAIETEPTLARVARKMQAKKVTRPPPQDVSPDHSEQAILWHSDSPSTPISSPNTPNTISSVRLEKQTVQKVKGVFESLTNYFSWSERTINMTRIPKVLFTLIYIFVVPAVFGGLFGTHFASLFLLVLQASFSIAYKASYAVLESFASSDEIRVARDDCPLVSSKDIRIFLTMNDRFPQIIAIASCGISISLLVIILVSYGSSKTKKMTEFFLKLIAVTVSTLCLCKIALIVILFYFPMHSFSQLLQNFLILEDNLCFTTSLGDSVTKSLIDLEDQFNSLKVWMWIDLGSISGIMLFPCIKYFGSWFSCKKRVKKSL